MTFGKGLKSAEDTVSIHATLAGGDLDIFEFDAGTVLNTPALPEEQDGGLPPWRFQ